MIPNIISETSGTASLLVSAFWGHLIGDTGTNSYDVPKPFQASAKGDLDQELKRKIERQFHLSKLTVSGSGDKITFSRMDYWKRKAVIEEQEFQWAA